MSTLGNNTDWGGVAQHMRACDLPYRQWSPKDTDASIEDAKVFNAWKKANCPDRG